jgi:hypothetical protein
MMYELAVSGLSPFGLSFDSDQQIALAAGCCRHQLVGGRYAHPHQIALAFMIV